MGWQASILVVLGLLVAPIAARGEDPSRPVPNQQACPVPPDDSWTTQERWVWQRVCLGQEADFNGDPVYGGNLDPRKPEGLPEGRVLRPSFIETMLLQDPYRHALTRMGVRITGARFTQRLNLRNAEIRHELWLDRSLFEAGADLSDAISTQRITLDGTKIVGDLDLRGLVTDRDFSMLNGSEVANVDLRRARIGGQLALSGLKVTGTLNMSRVHVVTQANLDEGTFGEVDLWNATIDGSLSLGGDAQANPPISGATVNGDLLLSDTVVGNWLSLSNAVVKGKLDMGELRVGHTLYMRDGKFADVDLTGAQIGKALELENATVSGKLLASRLSTGQSLYMRQGASFADVVLRNAQIGGQVDLTGAKVSQSLDMGGIVVAKEVLMFTVTDAPSEFAGVDLSGAHIGGELSMTGAKFTKTVDLETADVGLSVFMRNAVLSDVTLRGIRIGADLSAAGAKVSGSFDGFNLSANGTVELGNGSEFQDVVNVEFGKVGGLQLAGGTFHRDVNLTGLEIRTELNLGSPRADPPGWRDGASLVLHNAKADAIQDREDSWPDHIDLTGFTYLHLGGSGAAERPVEEKSKSDDTGKPAANRNTGTRAVQLRQMADRGALWFKGWLATQEQYSPQPYEQLAAVLRTQGWPDTADSILYASKDRERREASTWSHAAWLFVLKIVIGYGFQVWLALIWIGGLLGIGAAVQSTRPAAREHNWHQLLHYSFEMLLPVIRLRGQTREFSAGWQDYYFHFHGLMGFVLAAFLAAGLTGLTTR